MIRRRRRTPVLPDGSSRGGETHNRRASSSRDRPHTTDSGTAAAQQAALEAAAAQIQLLEEVAAGIGGVDGHAITNIRQIAIRMLQRTRYSPIQPAARAEGNQRARRNVEPNEPHEAYKEVTGMRLRRGESLTDEEYSTDLSIVNYLTGRGLSQLMEPMPPDVPQDHHKRVTAKVKRASDAALTSHHGGGSDLEYPRPRS